MLEIGSLPVPRGRRPATDIVAVKLSKTWAAADIFLGAIFVAWILLCVFGFIFFPDAPFRACGENVFCGKGGRYHTDLEFIWFSRWEKSFLFSFPVAAIAVLILNVRRSEIGKPIIDGETEIEEQRRYRAAWQIRKRQSFALGATVVIGMVLWIVSAILQSGAYSGPFLTLSVLWFVPLIGASAWYISFRCPRCQERFHRKWWMTKFMADSCVHCGLMVGARDGADHPPGKPH